MIWLIQVLTIALNAGRFKKFSVDNDFYGNITINCTAGNITNIIKEESFK